ncbi:hypothetical protein [Bacillus salipaludis]|uniref:Uncharacterized protein n=1 Tax=Bacillus salipaludis TaxID=2547811 RepID=A0AA90TXA6_9BACI|nr:hypothetical protein [Bacillus salipaludis]MDQ6601047.1 hypothetical protein [Bacillus salipaludis]
MRTTVTSVIFLIAILAIIVFLAVTKIDTMSKSEKAVTNASKKNVLTQTIAVLCIFLFVGIGGYVWRSNNITSQTDSTQTILTGQLTDFAKIESDMLNKINSKDFSSAKKGADKLEHQWDTSEAKLRKIDGTTWTQIDGTIDVVLAAVRSSTPDITHCKSALNDSLSVIKGANK